MVFSGDFRLLREKLQEAGVKHTAILYTIQVRHCSAITSPTPAKQSPLRKLQPRMFAYSRLQTKIFGAYLGAQLQTTKKYAPITNGFHAWILENWEGDMLL